MKSDINIRCNCENNFSLLIGKNSRANFQSLATKQHDFRQYLNWEKEKEMITFGSITQHVQPHKTCSSEHIYQMS